MKVNAQYAVEHFDELLTAIENGEEVEVTREGKESAKLQVVPRAAQAKSIGEDGARTSRRFGFARGLIRFAPDWDSAETNAAIAAAFETSDIFPVVPAASGLDR